MTRTGKRGAGIASEIEWVTLVSKDDHRFVMDRRFALQSTFIRSMLGGSSRAQRTKAKASKLTFHTDSKPKAERSEPDDNPTITGVSRNATPPPTGLSMSATATQGGDPEGYSNPFAPSDQQSQDDNEADDDVRAFNTFENGFAEAQSNVVHLPNIRGQVLETVVDYLCWSAKYSGAKTSEITDFEHRIPPEIAIEVLMAADFLNEA